MPFLLFYFWRRSCIFSGCIRIFFVFKCFHKQSLTDSDVGISLTIRLYANTLSTYSSIIKHYIQILLYITSIISGCLTLWKNILLSWKSSSMLLGNKLVKDLSRKNMNPRTRPPIIRTPKFTILNDLLRFKTANSWKRWHILPK